MEEDIKILEERVTTLKRHIKNYEESDCKTNVYQQLVKECNAIENVLQELKYNKIQFETQLREKLDSQANSIPISVIQNKIDEITKYRDLAKELIERNVVIADSDSLNYGRAEAHDKDIQVLQELLEERNK